jgi:DNA cross-link repair 1C protein
MSSFAGKMVEYPFLSIDRFDKENLDSVMFFLSHCHQDHMVGLNSPMFLRLLQTMNYKIYCHEITASLMCCDPRYNHLKPYLHSLQTNEPYVLVVPSASKPMDPCESDNTIQKISPVPISGLISVTLLPAYHCPGSVMFLFEGPSGVVLYTGDFRLSVDDIKAMSHLKSSSGFKIIETLYLDTTFCNAKTQLLPSREDSFNILLKEVQNWLSKSAKHKILLYTASKYGHEYLFCQLYGHLKEKIHVSDWKAAAYESVSALKKCVTTVSKATRIHACAYWNFDVDVDGGAILCGQANCDAPMVGHKINKKEKRTQYCAECSPVDPLVLTIKPSVMFFFNNQRYTI